MCRNMHPPGPKIGWTELPVHCLQFPKIGREEYIKISLLNKVSRTRYHISLITRLYNRGHVPGDSVRKTVEVGKDEMVMREIFVEYVQQRQQSRGDKLRESCRINDGKAWGCERGR